MDFYECIASIYHGRWYRSLFICAPFNRALIPIQIWCKALFDYFFYFYILLQSSTTRNDQKWMIQWWSPRSHWIMDSSTIVFTTNSYQAYERITNYHKMKMVWRQYCIARLEINANGKIVRCYCNNPSINCCSSATPMRHKKRSKTKTKKLCSPQPTAYTITLYLLAGFCFNFGSFCYFSDFISFVMRVICCSYRSNRLIMRISALYLLLFATDNDYFDLS